jgi:PAS domain-containing protein
MLYVKDAQTRHYVMINRVGEALLGDLPEPERRSLRDQGAKIFEREVVRRDGETRHLRSIQTLIDGPDRPDQFILGVTEDVTQSKRNEAEALRLAHHDP